ncbi:MAG: S4 domain-containing protein [Pseudomonadales bacterium]|nr:S4 domain-containing protein [Pseudomonadales bacterium]
MSEKSARVRLDKWLWAARFFKTRAKAKAAIEGGKVECDGVRAKPAKEIAVGAELRIRQGFDLRVVHVRGLSEQRRGATDAAGLYEETAESIEQREQEAARRRAQRALVDLPDQRPDRRDRRTLERIKKQGGLD